MTKVDQLIAKFKELKEELNKNVNASYAPSPNATTGTSGGEGGMYRTEKAEAVMSSSKLLKPKDVEDAGPESFKVTKPKDSKMATSERHPLKKNMPGMDALSMSEEVIKFDNNSQWSLDKADKPKAKAKAKTPAAVVAPADEADPTDPAAADPAAAALAKDPADPVAPAAAPAAAKASGAGSGSGNSPTKTNTETGGSSPGGASTGGVGSGLGGAGTGGAATGGASTGGAGTVTVTISGSSTTETSSGAGAKKGSGKGNKPAGPITLNISNVGGRTDAGNVASGDGPGASGSGGTAPNGFGGGGGGASPDEPKNFSTQGKDKMSKAVKVAKNGQWSLDKVDPEENINIAHPQGKAKMANGVNKAEPKTDGTNQRIANPPDSSIPDPRGRVHMVKEEGTNEEAGSSKPHNKGKFKVMDEVTEKESKKASPSGLPYNGEDKKTHK